MRIAVVQINPTLGDFKANSKKIIAALREAKEQSADLVVFPECSLFGYHPFDLLEQKQIVSRQLKLLNHIQKSLPTGVAALFGLLTENKKKMGRPFFNSCVLIENGKKPKFFNKELLPVGDVFDESRFIEKGSLKKNYFKLNGKQFFVTICEDIWAWPDQNGASVYLENPLKKVPRKKIDLIINLSASPFFPNKIDHRKSVVQKTSKYFNAPLLYVNLVGAQDEIIYDGQSFVTHPTLGSQIVGKIFEEDLTVFDLELFKDKSFYKTKLTKKSSSEILYKALVLGIKDFCQKNSIQKLHLGLSGGVDSALVAVLAKEAMGTENVSAIALPGPFNVDESLTVAKELAKKIGIKFFEIPIGNIYETYLQTLKEKLTHEEFGLVNENLQARIRGTLLMAFSNKFGSMLLNTSNKSEFAVGYSTLYGDMCGGLSPIGDLTKKQVYQLCEYVNKYEELIPKFIIERPPSAELRPNQKDQDSLPDYEILDKSVVKIVENSLPAQTAVEIWTLQALMKSEFKRWQAPPILKVSQHAFGRGRRWPIAHRAFID